MIGNNRTGAIPEQSVEALFVINRRHQRLATAAGVWPSHGLQAFKFPINERHQRLATWFGNNLVT